ncbi:hypothetical protein AUC70_13380 [Methyloceanibacter stevinii]|uniref:DUF2267 domain-containing protein n=1 Tax=Methyloceanibacter stevinii TaxID=1774970 RepID=A0A1E3VUL3_9HYPH|nr:DUF2267 domain-containing protein [Methyloceanibacter stevinii]ODR97238.1 hypothetical protein AUC70_13380 [Methyloceanibacter stevinii]
MTVPPEYLRASKDFEALLVDVRDTCMLSSVNQAYHTLRAVLHVFRDHVSVADALTFAGVLPAVPRAIFVEGWRPSGTPAPFPSRAALTREVKAIRPDHNLAPPSAISDVSAALRRAIEPSAFERVLSSLPPAASAFWAVEKGTARGTGGQVYIEGAQE